MTNRPLDCRNWCGGTRRGDCADPARCDRRSSTPPGAGLRRVAFGVVAGAACLLAIALEPAAARDDPSAPRDTAVEARDVSTDAKDVPAEAKDASKNLDVPYEGSEPAAMAAMMELARVGRDDFVIDLGSGDGRIVINAVKRFGARGLGVDLNAKLVDIAKRRAKAAGIADRARFQVQDIFETDISRATVLTMFLYPGVVMKLRPRILSTLAPGTRVVSNEHHLGLWRPDAARVVKSAEGRDGVVYMWTVPARMAGLWIWDLGPSNVSDMTLNYRAKLTQKFQDFGGEVVLGLQPMTVFDARLRGAEIAFSVSGEIGDRIVRHDFSGRIKGNEIAGTVRLSGGVVQTVLPWRAWRAPEVLK
ncbi:MAG: class I SAM-dependent methyltransferase [Alphaproteobacteria bacterium]|nr:class I SAM-dependent methyltransferase [Alphaproteobacteria bacterium]